MIITLTEFFFNVLVAAQGSSTLPLADTSSFIDEKFVWMVTSPLEVAPIIIISVALLFLRKYEFSEVFFWFSLFSLYAFCL